MAVESGEQDTIGTEASGGNPGRFSIGTVLICFLIALLDGFDTASIAFVPPLLSREWGIAAAAFTPAFVATNIGAVIGYFTCGPLAQRVGTRMVGGASVVLFASGTLLQAFAYDMTSLSALRLLSAVGLGGVLPICFAAAVQVVPPKYNETVTILLGTGPLMGSVVGGIIAGPLMQSFGWEAIFVVGGVLPLILLPAFVHVLAKSGQEEAGARSGSQADPIAALFGDGLAVSTFLLWVFSFFTFFATYALCFWIPTLLISFGFDAAQAPLGLAAFSAGGLVGNFLMMTIVAKWGVRNLVMAMMILAMFCVTIFSRADVPMGIVLPLVAGMGAGLTTGLVGQAALAVSLYPQGLRPTGIGWSAGCGRLGSIVGPALGGAMLSLGWPAHDIILTSLVPASLALLALAGLTVRERRRVLSPTPQF